MKLARAIVGWGVLAIGVFVGLVYLKSAAYRAWLAGGPPSDNPEGWLFSALNYLSWGVAIVLASAGLFLLLGGLRARPRAALALLLISAIFGIFPTAREYLASDACLDGGGTWLAQELRCKHE